MTCQKLSMRSIVRGSCISISTVLLCWIAVLYCGIQWRFASRIGPNEIFSRERVIERADFATMVRKLSEAAWRVCKSDPSPRLLFDDGDSASPYLLTSSDHFGSCAVVRQTNVTPFSQAELDDCDVVYIREHSPSSPLELRMDSTFGGSPRIEVERWTSGDSEYGFALYRHPCAATTEKK
jgi:hypothetical protein